MSRRHGRRPHRAVCNCTVKGACYTTWEAGMAAAANIPDAERVYRGKCCGHYHVTRYTLDEYAQRVAAYGVQDEVGCGTVVPSTTEEVHHGYEAQGPDECRATRARIEGREPGPGTSGPAAASLLRGFTPGQVPSPAAFARWLEGRGD